MKYLTLTAFMTVALLTTAQAQTPTQKYLDELIADENAFAKQAADSGVKKAFVMALDPNSINFEQQKPVNGAKLWANRPDDRKGSLYWYPANAAISVQGDLGFTMGPAIYKPNADSAQSFNSYFFSAWKRNANGQLKVMLDGGCRRPVGSQMEPRLTDGKPLAKRSVTEASKVTTTIEQLEKDFIAEWNQDATAAYQKYMADSAWAIRPNKYAGQNKQTNMGLVINPKLTQCKYEFVGGEVAKSNDLAYAYGTVTFTAKTTNGSEQQFKAFYIRTWLKLGSTWQIAGDMLSY